MNEARKLLKEAEEIYDNTETESAPSGEWAEYNIDYLQAEARWHGMQELVSAIGACAECEYFDTGMKDYCRRLNITCSPDWYCGDFKREEKERKDES